MRRGSVEDLPEADGWFDRACSVNLVQFLADRAAAFRKIYSLLKPQGVAATTYMQRGKNPSRENTLNMAAGVRRHMAVAGFANIGIAELPTKPVPAVCILGERP